MRWRRQRTDLGERLRPYVDTGPSPEPMVDVDPNRTFLFRRMVETGDPIEVVTRGFDLNAALASLLVERRERRLSAEEATSIARSVGLSVSEAAGRASWAPRDSASIQDLGGQPS